MKLFIKVIFVMAAAVMALNLDAGIAFAEPVEISAQASYALGDNDTMGAGKQYAKELAMRDAAEKAGVYLESRTEIKSHELTKDEISLLAGSIMQVKSIEYTQRLDGDKLVVTAHVKAICDPLDAETMKKRMSEEKYKEQYEDLLAEHKKQQEQYKKLEAEMRRVQEDHSGASDPVVHEQVSSMDALSRARRLEALHRYQEAESAYNEAVASSGGATEAYLARGEFYRHRNMPELARADYEAARARNPELANAWYGLGWCWDRLGGLQQAAEFYEGYLSRADRKSYDYRILASQKRLREIRHQESSRHSSHHVIHGRGWNGHS